jgi:hypothetical protein
VQIADKKSLREGQELGDLESEGMESALFCFLASPKRRPRVLIMVYSDLTFQGSHRFSKVFGRKRLETWEG